MLAVGTKIRFTQTLDAPSNEDHPAIVYAYRGETGRVIGHDAIEGYQVVSDRWPDWFGATDVEFEAIEDDASRPAPRNVGN